MNNKNTWGAYIAWVERIIIIYTQYIYIYIRTYILQSQFSSTYVKTLLSLDGKKKKKFFYLQTHPPPSSTSSEKLGNLI